MNEIGIHTVIKMDNVDIAVNDYVAGMTRREMMNKYNFNDYAYRKFVTILESRGIVRKKNITKTTAFFDNLDIVLNKYNSTPTFDTHVEPESDTHVEPDSDTHVEPDSVCNRDELYRLFSKRQHRHLYYLLKMKDKHAPVQVLTSKEVMISMCIEYGIDPSQEVDPTIIRKQKNPSTKK
jgi:hypothetical protein